METKISLGALGFPAPSQGEATPQKDSLPAREQNQQLAPVSPEPKEEVESSQSESVNMIKRSGTSRSFTLPNLPQPEPALSKLESTTRAIQIKSEPESADFDLKKGMRAGIPTPPQLSGLPVPPSMLTETDKEIQADHHKEEALTKLATKTIVDVQRLEVEFEKLKTEHHEMALKLQNTIDYLNAVYLQVQMLNSQNMYMAWHGRLVEYNLASLAGVQLERDLLDKARYQVQYWQQQTEHKQSEAEAAFAKLSP